MAVKKATAPGPAEKSEKVEELVFRIPGMKSAVAAARLREFSEKILPKVRLGDVGWKILTDFANIDVTAEKIGQALHANPYYESQFFRHIASLNKRETMPKLEAAVILLGMQNSRNFVIGIQLLRMALGAHPQWDENDKLQFSPKEVLKYALKAEDFAGGSGNKDTYADTAYAAGLIFDQLTLIASSAEGDPKKLLEYIDRVYTHGLKAAAVASQLSKSMPEFGFKKYLFSACLIHDVGKVALAILDPKYVDFAGQCSDREVPRAVRHFAENYRFGINHCVLGALICRQFRLFRPVERAVLHHHEPYLLKGRKKGLYELASLLSLASNVASNFKKIEKDDDPVVRLWKGPELQGFAVDTKLIREAVAKVV